MSAENYTEAAFTMKLYADQLTWNTAALVPDPNYPNQTECQVKEQLYRQIINNFDKGKVRNYFLHVKIVFIIVVVVVLVLGKRDSIN